jgi:hypothetical protein
VQLLQPRSLRLCSVEVGTVQYDGAAEARDVLVLDVGGARGHDDGRGDLEVARRVGDALGVVPCVAVSFTS